MLSREARPQNFKEMAGQALNKKILQAIIDNPENAPKVIILQGAFGSGKTTSARILARALNCKGSNKPCGKCPNCLQDLDQSTFYAEYDSAIVGNVDRIKELRDTFLYTVTDGYKVIVLDEIHLASKASQSALLKVLEEAPNRIFFVLATTDIDKVLPTIRSRAIELRYETVPQAEVVKSLKNLCSKNGFDVPEDILTTIAHKSRGHMRNAHMLLDQYNLIGQESFREVVKSSKDAIERYFLALSSKNKEEMFKSVDDIMTFPLADVTTDFQEVVLEISKAIVGATSNESAKKVFSDLGADTLKLVKMCISEWVISSFDSDATLQAALLCMYQMMVQSIAVSKSNQPNNPYARAVRR